MATKKPRSLPWRQRLFISPALAGQILNKSQSEMYQLLRAKNIPSVKCGRRWLVPTNAVIDYGQKLQEQG